MRQLRKTPIRSVFPARFLLSQPIMFRATVDTDVDGSVVRIAGQLTAEYLKDVERLCISAEPPVLIDADGLRSCDADGLAFLARMRDGAVRVGGLSEYLEMRLSQEIIATPRIPPGGPRTT